MKYVKTYCPYCNKDTVQDVKGLACVNCVYLPTWKPCEC